MIKKLLPLLLLILIGCSSPEPLNYQLLEKRDGVHYRKDTNEIYSGPVFNIKGKSTGYIKKGKFNGEFEFYHSNGQLSDIGSYKDGDGSDLGNTGVPRNGRIGTWKSYYENGQLRVDRTYKDGKLDGPYKSYYENGQLWEDGTYKDGKREGPFKDYSPIGKFYEEGTYKDGKRDGLFKLYGPLRVDRTYKDGELIDSKKY